MQGARKRGTYPGSYGVDNVPATAFEALAGIGYEYGHVGILIEDLLNAAGVVSSLTLRGGFASGLLGIFMADSVCRLTKRWALIVVARGGRTGSFEGAD